MTKNKKRLVSIKPEEEVDRAREFSFPFAVRPDFVRSIISFSESNFRSQSTSNDCDKRAPLDDATLSFENDESKLIRHFSLDEPSTLFGGFFVLSTITGGGNSALDSFQQHLATMVPF